MKKYCKILGLALLVLSVVTTESTRADESRLSLGLQGTHFLGGVSGVVEIAAPWALQGVIDFGLDAFALRVLNRFYRVRYWDVYGEGTVAVWDSQSQGSWGRWGSHSYDNNFGLGVGIGVEYDWRGLNDRLPQIGGYDRTLPPITWNIEVGTNIMPYFSAYLGLGAHWKF